MTDFHLALSQQNLTPGVVQPGQSARLTVTLQPGSYEMYCPVGLTRLSPLSIEA